MNIFIPSWLLWAIPLAIWLIGFVVMGLACLTNYAMNRAHGISDSMIKNIVLCVFWPFALIYMWVFMKKK